MIKRKSLFGHAQAQAKVIIDNSNDYIALQSYNTIVCEVIDNKLTCNGLYSRTTIKHIGWFAKEYTNIDYHKIKEAFLKGCTIDIINGSMQPIK